MQKIVLCLAAQLHFQVLLGGFKGVFKQNPKNLLHAEPVDMAIANFRHFPLDKLPPAVRADGGGVLPCVAPHFGDVARLNLDLQGSGEVPQIFKEPRQVSQRPLGTIDQLQGFRLVFDTPAGTEEARLGPLQRVAALMRESGDHLPDRRQSL